MKCLSTFCLVVEKVSKVTDSIKLTSKVAHILHLLHIFFGVVSVHRKTYMCSKCTPKNLIPHSETLDFFNP